MNFQKPVLGLFAAALTLSSSAFASVIFVKEARGQLTRAQRAEVTSLIQNSVRKMPEHTLVRNQGQADYVLQPSVVARGDELILRVEKIRNGELLSMSEETINTVNASRTRAMAVVETALHDSSYGKSYGTDDDGATTSATSESASEQDVRSHNNIVEAAPAHDNASNYQSTGTDATARSPGADASVGELTSASPRMMSADRAGQIQLGVGPSFAINMKDDALMYDLLAAYAIDFNDNVVGKIFGDFNLGTGSSTTRFINLGVAAEYYPTRELLTFGKPYLGADLGFAFARDALNRTGDAPAAGLAAGFKFQAAQMNSDVNAHYDLLLTQIADETPSVFGLRVAVGF